MPEIKLKIKAVEEAKALEEATLKENLNNYQPQANNISKKIITLKKDIPVITDKKIEIEKKEENNLVNKGILKNEIIENENSEEVKKEEDGPIFENYDSEFYKNEKSIIQKIRNSRIIPKTRLGFVFSVIILSIIIVSGFWIFDPKHHSIESYKANIIGISNKIKLLTEKKENIDIIETNSGTVNNDVNSQINTGALENNSFGTGKIEEIKTNTGKNEDITKSGSLIKNDVNNFTGTTSGTGKIEEIKKGEISGSGAKNNESKTQSGANSGSGVINEVFKNQTGSLDENTKDAIQLIQEKWLSIEAKETILATGEKVYEYNGSTYTKEGLKEKLKEEVKIELAKKTKEQLNKIYLSNKK